jgi:RNA polymerase sigma-70 factor, ECF subfamily
MTMDSQQLRDTIARLQKGDNEACEELVSAYGARLYGYFLRACGNHHDAEDLLGECLLRVVRTIEKYTHDGRFEPWLFRIAANLVRDRIRRKKVRPTAMSLSAEDDDGHSMAETLSQDAPAVDRTLLQDEASAELQQALARLDETTREMILLRHFGEMSFKDIAANFDCPLGTALARVHRGLKALRTALETPSQERQP